MMMRSVKCWIPLLLAAALPVLGFADGYYSPPTMGYSPYNSYGGYGGGGYGGYSPSYGGRQSNEIISLELNPQESLNTSFRIAAREGRLADLERFAQTGADVNSASDQGETALMYAARNCSGKVVAELVRLKSDVNVRDRQGRTALMYAAEGACLPVVRSLVSEPGIEIKVRDRSGRNALDYAEEVASADVDGPAIDAIHALKTAMRARPRKLVAAARHE